MDTREFYEQTHDCTILNWDELPKGKGKRRGLPAWRSKVMIKCKDCGAEVQKTLTEKVETNGHMGRCQACAKVIGDAKAGKTRIGRVHTEETKAKMRAWWADQLGDTSLEASIREVIEDIVGGEVLNWSDLQLTKNGTPKEYVDGNRQTIIANCQKCGSRYSQQFRFIKEIKPVCAGCCRAESWVGDQTLRSGEEKEVEDFLISLGVKFSSSNKSLIPPYELDFVIDDKCIAIEYNGLYWHSEANKEKDYHLKKTKRCMDVGYQLIHIFQDEWVHRKEQVKSRLRHILGFTESRAHARRLTIRDMDGGIVEFFNTNHLQGWVGATRTIGAFDGDTCLAAMSFSPARMGIGAGGDHWELVRFAVASGWSIPGIASRLLRYFRKDYHGSIVSYADARWSTGGIYQTLGFTLTGWSPPNYWYTKRDRRYHRLQFRKDRLISDGYDPTLTERQIMAERGFLRIYDCGSLTFRLDP